MSSESWINLMKGFAIFAVAYLVRPFGGILFGMFGDTFGRKKVFVYIMLLMAFSTFAIGLLPSYAQIGIIASVLLVLFRLLQGLSFGAELPGAITIVNEYSEQKKVCLHSSFVISSVSMGSALASFILYLLAKNINHQQILDWGWRIPFLLGGIFAFVLFFIRKHLQETPEFMQLQTTRSSAMIKTPLLNLWKNYRSRVLYGIGQTFLVSSLVIFNLYLPVYLNSYFGFSLSNVYLAMTCSLIWSFFSMPICGYLSDKVGLKKIFLFTCIGFSLMAFALFQLLTFKTAISLYSFMILYQTIISFLMTSNFPMLSAAFPVEVRYTGIAICYNVAYAMMGIAPTAITFMIQKTNNPFTAVWFLIGSALISIASIMLLRMTTRSDNI